MIHPFEVVSFFSIRFSIQYILLRAYKRNRELFATTVCENVNWMSKCKEVFWCTISQFSFDLRNRKKKYTYRNWVVALVSLPIYCKFFCSCSKWIEWMITWAKLMDLSKYSHNSQTTILIVNFSMPNHGKSATLSPHNKKKHSKSNLLSFRGH